MKPVPSVLKGPLVLLDLPVHKDLPVLPVLLVRKVQRVKRVP